MKNGPIFEKSQKTFKKLLKITFVQKLLTHPLGQFWGKLKLYVAVHSNIP